MFEVLSPCKLNLFLYVTGKREDGFHNLQSLFCILDHGDTMRFEVKDDGKGEFKLLNDMGFAIEQNLIYKAWKELCTQSSKNFSVTVDVDKRLPMGGGLGGGSSNAATTLLVLNHLAKLGFSNDKLCEIGAMLGSDVPFFVAGHSAFVQGRGEVLKAVDVAEKFYLVITPKVHISTKDVFTNPELKEHYSPVRSFEELMASPFGNDLIAIVRNNYCEIGHTLDRLVKYGVTAMSGTGASCFVSFDSEQEAHAALSDFTVPFAYDAFVARSLNESHVIKALTSDTKQ